MESKEALERRLLLFHLHEVVVRLLKAPRDKALLGFNSLLGRYLCSWLAHEERTVIRRAKEYVGSIEGLKFG